MARSPKSWFVVLILVTFVLRLAWAASLETGQDEAYHFLYSVYPDWSYFDHPPMLRYVTQCGIFAFGGWLHPLSLRFGFVAMFAGSTWIMYRWTSRWYGESAGFYAALALNLCAYYSAAAGAFVLPDGPLLFFALLTMWGLSESLIGNPGRIVPWLWVGLACAGAMLSKYHAVFLPLCALAYIIVTPAAWKNLRTPGPYLAALIGFLGLLPVLIWNSQHDWASFGFQSSRAMGGTISLSGIATNLFGPMALLFPWIWVPIAGILVSRVISFRTSTGIDRLLLCQAIIPLAMFTVVSMTRPILPHWPLIGYLPLFPLLGNYWAAQSAVRPLFVRRWLMFMGGSLVLIAIAFVIQARFAVVHFPFRDPCTEISGWESVGKELASRGLVDRPNTFLFTNHWFDSGQAAFAVRTRTPVACYVEGDARGFAYWSRPEDWVGKDGILLDPHEQNGLIEVYRPFFRDVTPLPPIPMLRGSRSTRTVRVFLCSEQLRPFPFAYERRTR